MLHGPFHNAQLSWGERSQGQPPYWPRDAGLKVNAQSFFRRLALTAVHLVSKCLPTTRGQSLHAGGARHWRSNQKPCAPIAPRRLGPTGGQGTLELIAMNFSGGSHLVSCTDFTQFCCHLVVSEVQPGCSTWLRRLDPTEPVQPVCVPLLPEQVGRSPYSYSYS